MKVNQILNIIAAANQLTPEQTQILEKGLRKLDTGHSTDGVLEFLREKDYPLIEETASPQSDAADGIPSVEDWDENTNKNCRTEYTAI
jgi:hypothetical protein